MQKAEAHLAWYAPRWFFLNNLVEDAYFPSL